MRLLDSVRDSVRSWWMGPLNSGDRELARWFNAPTQSSTGLSITEETALTYSAVWSAVSLISADVASLPLLLYKRSQGGGKERFVNHNLYRLLHDEPNPEMSSMIFRETLQAHLLTWGNAYAEIQRDNGGRPSALWPIVPHRVTPARRPNGAIVYRVSRVNGGEDELNASDMLHVPGLGYNGLIGYSVIAHARESIGLGLATERFGATFFGNGSTFGGVLTHPQNLTKDVKEGIRESIEAVHQGVDRAHKFVILGGGMKYDKLGIPPNDAQFLETRKFQINEIARWFRVPPHKIGDLDRSTNNNIEQQAIEYYTDTLRPWLVRWEQELNRKLIMPSERNIQYVEHMIDGVLRGDQKSRYDAYAVGRQWGWLCADDIADRENMNPLPNGVGKIYLVPLNMAPADKIGDIVDAQIEAKTKPSDPAPVAPAAPDGEAVAAAARAIEAIREALSEAQTRAEAHLARASALEAELSTAATDAASVQSDLGVARADAAAAQQAVSVHRALLLEATERADRLDAEREAAAIARAEIEALAERDRQSVVESTARADRLAADAETRARELDVATARMSTIEADYQRVCEENRNLNAERVTDVAVLSEVRTQQIALAEQLVGLQQSVIDAREALAVAQTRADDAKSALLVEQQARVEAETSAQAVSAHMLAVRAAVRATVIDRLAWVISHESDRARSQAGSPEKFRRWVETFYPAYGDKCRDILRVPVQAWVVTVQHPEPVEHVLDLLVSEHLETSLRALRALLDEQSADTLPAALERTLRRWDKDRAARLAQRILPEAA